MSSVLVAESISATVSYSEPGLHNRSSAFDVRVTHSLLLELRGQCQSALKAYSIAAASA